MLKLKSVLCVLSFHYLIMYRELNGAELRGNNIRVQESTSGVRTKPGMDGEACFRSAFVFHLMHQ